MFAAALSWRATLTSDVDEDLSREFMCWAACRQLCMQAIIYISV